VTTVAGRLDPVQVAAGTVVVRQGAPADKFFIIVEGELEVIREDDGTSRTVATLRQGQFFGEMAILRDLPRTATVRATTPATLLAMERDDFRALVAQSLATTQDFDRVIQQRLDELGGARGA
jgi:CRP-like cAMP-binding protein